MKKYFAIVLLFLFGCAGYMPIEESERYTEYIEEHPLTKDKAYDATLEWIATNFRSANTVIQLKEKENGRIIVQAVGSYSSDILQAVIMNYNYTFSIRIADKKIKYEFTINNIVGGSTPPTKHGLPDIKKSFIETKNSIQNAIKNYTGNVF